MTEPDHFSLFGLPTRFAVDEDALASAYRTVQAQVHPDRFASAGAAERRVALEWAARANEAFRVLRSPLRRATYLCEVHGARVDSESNTSMPAAFLVEQMAWREALEEARAGGDVEALAQLARRTDAAHREALGEIGQLIDERGDYAGAAAVVRRLMFVEKFRDEVAAASADHGVDFAGG
ncbi:MAG TPA: Fe-S protein assembly co-chaperone HscB [Burkholderiaceae bacterium]|nr:Fe-S protein assembly co-chaperone HscB [Burkholderiaceae bacterium]